MKAKRKYFQRIAKAGNKGPILGRELQKKNTPGEVFDYTKKFFL